MVKIRENKIECECSGIFKPLGLGSPIVKCSKCGRKGNIDTLEFDPIIYEVSTIQERKESWISTSTKKDPDSKKDWLNKYLK